MHPKIFSFLISILLLSATSEPLTAQEDSNQSEWNERLRELSVLDSGFAGQNYRLGPGDLLEITVFGVDEFSRTYRISESNTITMPHLGKVSAGGITGEELESSIAELLTIGGLVNEPMVSVFIKEYRSQPVYVLGAVAKPGQYMITHQLTLIDLLAMAGGLDPGRAANYALVQRPQSGPASAAESAANLLNPPDQVESDSDVLRVDLEAMLKEGDLSLNLSVQGGDVIHVPARRVDYYYVVGDVVRPGVYELPIDEDDRILLLTQAVAKAGGPEKTAKMSDGILVRYTESGDREEMAVDFNAILRGRNVDMAVEPNDIIFIPGSKFKTIGYGLLGVIPSTLTRSVPRVNY